MNISDGITREDSLHDARLGAEVFEQIDEWTGFQINIDWMASHANGHRVRGKPLPFVPRYIASLAEGTNVLSQHMGCLPGTTTTDFGFRFPPIPMNRAVVAHAKECRAEGVFLLSGSEWKSMVPASKVKGVVPIVPGREGSLPPNYSDFQVRGTHSM